MKLAARIKLLHRSSERMMSALGLNQDEAWWVFMRREARIHLKRAFRVWWAMRRKKP